MAKRTRQASTDRDSSYFTRLGMELELQRLEEKAEQIRAWLGRLPARVREKVQGLTGGPATGVAAAPAARGRRRKRKMSAEARRRISEAQKARWAKQKGEQAASATEAAPSEATSTASKAKRGRRGGRRKGAKGRGGRVKA
jgi:hypothetical protein